MFVGLPIFLFAQIIYPLTYQIKYAIITTINLIWGEKIAYIFLLIDFGIADHGGLYRLVCCAVQERTRIFTYDITLS